MRTRWIVVGVVALWDGVDYRRTFVLRIKRPRVIEYRKVLDR